MQANQRKGRQGWDGEMHPCKQKKQGRLLGAQSDIEKKEDSKAKIGSQGVRVQSDSDEVKG